MNKQTTMIEPLKTPENNHTFWWIKTYSHACCDWIVFEKDKSKLKANKIYKQ